MHYDFITIPDADVPQAVELVFQHVVTTYVSEANKTASHSGALRFPVGLKEGWEDRQSAARAERAAANQTDEHQGAGN